MDAVRHPVVHRAQAQAAFELTPCLLDTLQLLIAQSHVRSAQGIVVACHLPRSRCSRKTKSHVRSAQGIVVAVHDERPVEAFGGLDRAGVDERAPGAGHTNLAPVAAAGAQGAYPLAVAVDSVVG